jgi:hypothetical protein
MRSRGKPKCDVDEAFIQTATFLMSVESQGNPPKRVGSWYVKFDTR